MEEVLDVYKRPYDETNPWVCFDESCKQLVKEIRDPIPTEPGQLERYDYQYERNGVANLFMFFEPLTGWRHVEVTDQRTAVDYAHQMKYLVDERYPQADKIGVIQDQLNTHAKASLYKAFEPKEAKRILDKLEFYCRRYHLKKPRSTLRKDKITYLITFGQIAITQFRQGRGLRSPSQADIQTLWKIIEQMNTPTSEQKGLVNFSLEDDKRMEVQDGQDQEELLRLGTVHILLEKAYKLLTGEVEDV
ncbi:transposase [Nostoc carneum NIES-2107]|nr:transposase [Nostoc carneum NIES-2107]